MIRIPRYIPKTTRRRRASNSLTGYRLTRNEIRVFACLKMQPQIDGFVVMLQREISAFLGIQQSKVSYALKRLESMQLIERVRDVKKHAIRLLR